MRTPRSSHGSDAGAGVVIALFGIGWTVLAWNIPPDPSRSSVIGPAVFPVLFGVLLTAGALTLVTTSLLKARAGRTPVGAATSTPPPPPAPDPEAHGGPRRSFWVLTGLLAGYVLLFLPLGYLLSTAVFTMALMTYLRPRRVIGNVVFAVLFPVAVYLLFGFGLRITLPAGVLSGVLP